MSQSVSCSDNYTSFFLAKNKSKPDFGYTTGTCAAAASSAAARMLVQQKFVPYVFVHLPEGSALCLEVLDAKFSETSASCAVKKESGTDPDITNGILVYSSVEFSSDDGIKILGGKGIGKVTLPGLDQKVGEWAINSVPQKMIRDAVSSELNNIHKGIKVTISIPSGVELANKTFNPRLGIVGGISVLGTTGIVRPMSEDAIVQTIRAEISMRAALHYTVLPVVPGNYGMDFLTHEFGFDFGFAVESSNFSYDSILMAKEYGFKKYFLTGHLGKLVKIAGGAKNTHSKYGDGRMQTLCSASKEFCKEEDYFLLQKEIMACVSTENAVDVLIKFNLKEKVLNKIAELVKMNMQEWVPEVHVELVLFTKKHGVLAMTNKAFDFINELKACAARQEEK